MMKIVWSSDWHLGLKTDEIDRTDEIFNVGKDIIDKAIEYKEEGHDTILVLGGDIFDNNTPSERHIAVFIKLLKRIKEHNLKTFVMVGNHEAIADPNRLSCLSFIKELKSGYPSIELVEDIKIVKVGILDTGPMYLTFLPHISRATIEAKVKNKKLKQELTTQQYIESKSKRIAEKLGPNSNHIVFSHLNVRGAHGGSEENLLKRSEVYLPKIFTDPPLGMPQPIIIQGHIHSNQMVGNDLYIIGSPIFCTFGEALTPKYYAEINVKGQLSVPDEVIIEETKYRPFLQTELDMVGETRDFFEIPEVTNFLDKIANYADKNPIVKFDISIDPECNNYDWTTIRNRIQKDYSCFVKNIVPRILVKRQVRSSEQKINLPPKKAIQIYVKRNLKKNPEKAKQVYALSLKYLGETHEQSRV
jgi:exonuclease SbcD